MIDSPLYAIPSQAPKWSSARILEGFGVPPNHLSAKEWLSQAAAKEIQQCGDAQPRWDAVWKKAMAVEPLVPVARRDFYREQVLAMIAINRESNRILLEISKAVQDARNGNKPQARQEIDQALASFDQIQRAEKAAEYGKWRNWYRGDWLTGIYRTRQLVETFSKLWMTPRLTLRRPFCGTAGRHTTTSCTMKATGLWT